MIIPPNTNIFPLNTGIIYDMSRYRNPERFEPCFLIITSISFNLDNSELNNYDSTTYNCFIGIGQSEEKVILFLNEKYCTFPDLEYPDNNIKYRFLEKSEYDLLVQTNGINYIIDNELIGPIL